MLLGVGPWLEALGDLTRALSTFCCFYTQAGKPTAKDKDGLSAEARRERDAKALAGAVVQPRCFPDMQPSVVGCA